MSANAERRKRREWKFMLLVLLFGFAQLKACAAASLYERAEEAQFHQNYDSAIELFQRSIKEEPGHSASATSELFRLYVRLHRFEDAASFLREAEAVTGKGDYTRELADVYQNAGKHYEAQRLYREYLSSHPDDADALCGLGMTLEATGNFEEARDVFTRALTADGGARAETARQHIARTSKATSALIGDEDPPVVKWASDQLPVKVFIGDGSKSPGWKSELRTFVEEAIAKWNAAGRGVLSVTEVPDESAANIVVLWVPRLEHALGVTEYRTDGRVVVKITTAVDEMNQTLPPESPATRNIYEAHDRMIREVVLHEFGHALGLRHSPRTDDIMAPNVFGLNSRDVIESRDLQPNDIRRLRALYAPGKNAGTANQTAEAEAAATAEQADAGHKHPTAPRTVQQAEPGKPRDGTRRSMDLSVEDVALKDAMFQLTAGNYQSAIDTTDTILNRNPNNAKAHYVRAVAAVNERDYEKAKLHYRAVLRIVPHTKLADLAATGLAKLQQ